MCKATAGTRRRLVCVRAAISRAPSTSSRARGETARRRVVRWGRWNGRRHTFAFWRVPQARAGTATRRGRRFSAPQSGCDRRAGFARKNQARNEAHGFRDSPRLARPALAENMSMWGGMVSQRVVGPSPDRSLPRGGGRVARAAHVRVRRNAPRTLRRPRSEPFFGRHVTTTHCPQSGSARKFVGLSSRTERIFVLSDASSQCDPEAC